MHIQNTTSLKQEITKMDKLMRHANRTCPRLSPYRAKSLITTQKKKDLFEPCINKLGSIVDSNRAKCTSSSFSTLGDIIKSDVKNLKQSRLGDCGESSALIIASLLANGYKDGEIVRLLFDAEARDMKTNELLGRRTFDTTHELVVRELSDTADAELPKKSEKELVILDAWAGFCANVQEAFKKYYELFMNGMRNYTQPEQNVTVTYTPILKRVAERDDFKSLDCDEFKRAFPELIV